MIASKRHTVNIKNINIRHTQFGGASLDINTALPRASPPKDPTKTKTRQRRINKNRTKNKNKDKEEERQRTKNQTRAQGAYTYHDCSGSRRRLVRLEWLMN